MFERLTAWEKILLYRNVSGENSTSRTAAWWMTIWRGSTRTIRQSVNGLRLPCSGLDCQSTQASIIPLEIPQVQTKPGRTILPAPAVGLLRCRRSLGSCSRRRRCVCAPLYSYSIRCCCHRDRFRVGFYCGYAWEMTKSFSFRGCALLFRNVLPQWTFYVIDVVSKAVKFK